MQRLIGGRGKQGELYAWFFPSKNDWNTNRFYKFYTRRIDVRISLFFRASRQAQNRVITECARGADGKHHTVAMEERRGQFIYTGDVRIPTVVEIVGKCWQNEEDIQKFSSLQISR